MMNPIAHALGQALLDHHQAICKPVTIMASDMNKAFVEAHCLSYGALVERAGHPCPARFAGKHLYEVAVWCCTENGWPPIHALAVKADTKIPGEGYDGAPGGGFALWEEKVRECIAFKGYPSKI
jgi:hypothetical protein